MSADLAPRQRTFVHLLANTLAVSVTNMTVWFAPTFWVYLETRSVFATGIISGVYLTFTALSGMWFGSLVDHHGKRPVMIASSLASLGVYGVCLAVHATAGRDAFRDPASVWLWVLVLMTGVIAGNVRTIAMSTLVTLLVPEDRRDRANGLVGTTTGITFLATSVVAAVRGDPVHDRREGGGLDRRLVRHRAGARDGAGVRPDRPARAGLHAVRAAQPVVSPARGAVRGGRRQRQCAGGVRAGGSRVVMSPRAAPIWEWVR